MRTLIRRGNHIFGSDSLWVDMGCDLARVQILLDLEEQFGVELIDDEIEGIGTVADLIQIIDRRRTKGRAA